MDKRKGRSFRHLAVTALAVIVTMGAVGNRAFGQAPSRTDGKLRVAVAITDSLGVVTSAISSALRKLGDVEVVTSKESPHLVLGGVVLCDPANCRDVDGYTAALSLSEPFNDALASTIASRLTNRGSRDSVARVLTRWMGSYEVVHESWVVRWGRDRVEGASARFVAEIDSQCLDRVRAYNRYVAADELSGDAAWRAYEKIHTSRQWLC